MTTLLLCFSDNVIAKQRRTQKGRNSVLHKELMQFQQEVDVKRTELVRKRRRNKRRKRRVELHREEGETLDKRRKTAHEQEHAFKKRNSGEAAKRTKKGTEDSEQTKETELDEEWAKVAAKTMAKAEHSEIEAERRRANERTGREGSEQDRQQPTEGGTRATPTEEGRSHRGWDSSEAGSRGKDRDSEGSRNVHLAGDSELNDVCESPAAEAKERRKPANERPMQYSDEVDPNPGKRKGTTQQYRQEWLCRSRQRQQKAIEEEARKAGVNISTDREQKEFIERLADERKRIGQAAEKRSSRKKKEEATAKARH